MKKALIITGCIIGGLIILFFAAELFIAKKVRHAIEQKLPEATDGRYDSELGRVSVNLLRRSVKLSDLRIRTNEGDKQYTGNLPAVDASIERLVITGIGYRSGDQGRRISAGSVRIVRPNISMSDHDDTVGYDSSSMSGNMFDGIALISVKRFRIDEGHIDYTDTTEGDTVSYWADGLNLMVRGIEIGSEASTDKIFYSDNISLSVDYFRHIFAEQCNTLEAESIALDTDRGRASLASFNLTPNLPKYEFAWKAPRHADWLEINAGSVNIEGIDFEAFSRDSTLRIEKIEVDGVDLDTYKNRKINRREWVKPIVFQTLHNVPIPLDIGSVSVKNMKAAYEELPVKGAKAGRIFFTNLNGEFTDISNRPRPEKPYFKLVASAMLMGAGALNATFNFPTDPASSHFTVSGRLGSMDVRVLNPMIEPLAKIEAESGTINSLTFNMSANAHSAQTQMTMLYDDLKAMILKENDEGEFRERRFISGLANLIIIKDSNPDRRGTRTTEATAVRDPYRSQFNYLWKMLLPGLKETIGIPDKETETFREKNGEIIDDGVQVHPKGIFSLNPRKKRERRG